MKTVSATEAARKMGVTRNWLYVLIAMGRIFAIRNGEKEWKIPVGEITHYLKQKEARG